MRPTPLLLAAAVSLAAATPARAQPDIARLHEGLQRDTASLATALDGCVRVHHVWKRQVDAVHRTAGRPARERTAALVEAAYRPYAGFWAGYLGDEAAFARWAGERFRLEDDPRRVLPFAGDVAALVAETTRRMAALTGRTGCGEWFLVYGPGWTNMGGLGGRTMVADFFGMPRYDGLSDARVTAPHEVNHLIFGPAHAADPDTGTVLLRALDEGFATWIADLYWGHGVSPADALGYTEDEWRWALEHERELWAAVRPHLASRERATADRLFSAGTRPLDGGPPKVGYFVGYRVVQAYVDRHGPESWRRLYDLPAARILRDSGYERAMR